MALIIHFGKVEVNDIIFKIKNIGYNPCENGDLLVAQYQSIFIWFYHIFDDKDYH